jgi:hypothetical protein
MLLYVLIKDNEELRREATHWRGWLIQLVSEENEISMLATDLLCEVYHDNRNIVVSDVGEMKTICGNLLRLLEHDNKHELSSNNFLNIRINKLLHLISIFLVVEGKKIKNNYQEVINELFDKDNLMQYVLKLKNIHHFTNPRKDD